MAIGATLFLLLPSSSYMSAMSTMSTPITIYMSSLIMMSLLLHSSVFSSSSAKKRILETTGSIYFWRRIFHSASDQRRLQCQEKHICEAGSTFGQSKPTKNMPWHHLLHEVLIKPWNSLIVPLTHICRM